MQPSDFDLTPFLHVIEDEINAKVPRDGRWHYITIPVKFNSPAIGVPEVTDAPPH